MSSKKSTKSKPKKAVRPRRNAKPEYKKGSWDTVRSGDHASMQNTLRVNAEMYYQSLLHPFEVRGVRLPDESPFPSAVGTWIGRVQPTAIDGSGTSTGKRYNSIWLYPDITDTGVFYANIAAVVDGVDIWGSTPFPPNAQFQENFSLARIVSLGVRVVNTAAIVGRGGAIYTNYTTRRIATEDSLQYLKQAVETQVYDASMIRDKGLECVYIPLSYHPVQSDAGSLNPTGSTYVSPSIVRTTTMTESSIVIWAEGTTDEDLSLIFEIVANYEAIPYPDTEYLFDRRSVVTSSSAMATAKEAVGSAVNAGTKPDSLLGGLGSTMKKIGGMVPKNLFKWGVKQIESSFPVLSGVGEAIGLLDRRHRAAALTLGFPHLNPLRHPKLRGLTTPQFKRLIEEAQRDERDLVTRPSPKLR